jgi:hypothetical protein
MTGRQAETWRKFTFRRTPWWALIFGLVGMSAFSTRVTGHLPLTRASSRKVTLLRSFFFVFIPLAVGFWVGSAIVAPNLHVDSTRSAISGWLFLAGLASFFVAVLGIVFGRNAFGPTGKVRVKSGETEPGVELRRVHPNFVGAVQQVQHSRLAQSTSSP